MTTVKKITARHFPGIQLTYVNSQMRACDAMKMTNKDFNRAMSRMLLLADVEAFKLKAAQDQEVCASDGQYSVVSRKDQDIAVVRYRDIVFTVSKAHIFGSQRMFVDLKRKAQENLRKKMDEEIARLVADGCYFQREDAIVSLQNARFNID